MKYLAESHALLDAVLEALHQPLLQPVLLLDHPVQQALKGCICQGGFLQVHFLP